jgi:hypothetical protein
MYAQLVTSDTVILESLDSYLAKKGMPPHVTPEQMIIIKDQMRYQLYSDIVQRVPRIASYILHANMDIDDNAQGLFKALYHHCMDPKFIELLLMYLDRRQDADEKSVTGALLVKIFTTYLDKEMERRKSATTETKTKKGEKPEPEPQVDQTQICAEVDHIHTAAMKLLGDITRAVSVKCGNLDNNPGAMLAIAACVAMNNGDSIRQIFNMDLPVIADVFDIINDPTNIIKGALLLKKDDYVKTTKNQEEFLTSLKRWVYGKLNSITTQESYRFLVSVYGSIKPTNIKDYLIQIKDCGTQYSNLLIVAKQLVNQ